MCWCAIKKLLIHFAIFGLQHLVVSPVGGNLRNLNTGAVHNHKPSPIQQHQNRFCTWTPSWRNWVHKLWCSKVWRTDKHRDKQTKNSTFLAARRRVKSEPHQTWHGDRGPRACSCTSKTFGVWRIVSLLGGAENLWVTRPCLLKTPITP